MTDCAPSVQYLVQYGQHYIVLSSWMSNHIINTPRSCKSTSPTRLALNIPHYLCKSCIGWLLIFANSTTNIFGSQPLVSTSMTAHLQLLTITLSVTVIVRSAGSGSSHCPPPATKRVEIHPRITHLATSYLWWPHPLPLPHAKVEPVKQLIWLYHKVSREGAEQKQERRMGGQEMRRAQHHLVSHPPPLPTYPKASGPQWWHDVASTSPSSSRVRAHMHPHMPNSTLTHPATPLLHPSCDPCTQHPQPYPVGPPPHAALLRAGGFPQSHIGCRPTPTPPITPCAVVTHSRVCQGAIGQMGILYLFSPYLSSA